MNTTILRLVLALSPAVALVNISCERSTPDVSHSVSIESLTGLVQKGPYINGTSVNVAELTPELVQTGKNFNAQISDNRGSFELNQIELSSQFVELKADGFYFNEITGASSSARLNLYALSDLTDKNTLNVNLISHLERDRIYQLISEGMSFSNSKSQAQREILEIFSIEKSDIQDSEMLDISQTGEDHAILLAISLILQGHRSVAELSELLANINSDLREDGVLNSASSGSALITHARLLDPVAIRENLEFRYAETGLLTELPDFKKYLNVFIESSDFEVSPMIVYPEYSNYGENILFGDKSNVVKHQQYSLAADLSVGTQLKIKLSGGLWYYEGAPQGPVNWDISGYNQETKSQTFTATESGKSCDLKIMFEFNSDSTTNGDGILLEYFENQSDTATRTKIITFD